MILAIADAMIDLIRASVATVKTVERYAGQLEPDEAGSLLFIDPAVFIVYSGSTPQRVDNRMFFEPTRLLALCACRNLVSRAAAENDAVALAREVLALFANQTLELDIEPLTPTLVELVFISGDLCVYGVHLETSFNYVPITAPA